MSVYEKITQSIVQAIETGAAKGENWQMPWHRAGGRPLNIATGRAYRGVNILALWCEEQSKSYSSGKWGTFKQWQSKGAKVKKGEKGSMVVFWKDIKKEDDEEDKPRFVLKTSYAFNADQVDGFKEEKPSIGGAELVANAEFFINNVRGLDLRFGGGRAYYSPLQDYVQMPELGLFRDTHGYYGTLLHECAHWTGNSKRLNRDFSRRFGNEAYAFEELVAELSAAFLCGDLGLSSKPRKDHAEYIASWLEVLRNDSRAIFKASTEAAKAADYLQNFSQKSSDH